MNTAYFIGILIGLCLAIYVFWLRQRNAHKDDTISALKLVCENRDKVIAVYKQDCADKITEIYHLEARLLESTKNNKNNKIKKSIRKKHV